jgi:Mrp family chromosome partitioning ATPase
MALALARAYALSGQSTLLVDCDLRKPGIHLALGRQVSDGLFDYLAGKVTDLGAIIALDAMSGAQVVLGSRRSDIATDQLVSGKAFARLLAAARENFDVVILDTPPVGPVVDGLYLAGKADAVVVVVEWATTPQQQVRAAIEALAGAGPAPLVAVLNRQQGGPAASRGGYYAD